MFEFENIDFKKILSFENPAISSVTDIFQIAFKEVARTFQYSLCMGKILKIQYVGDFECNTVESDHLLF